MLLDLVEKTKKNVSLLILAKCNLTSNLVYLGVIKTTCQVTTINLIQLLDEYCSGEKKMHMWKNEKSNLNIITTILKFVINCEVLDSKKSFSKHLFWACFFL